MSSTKVNDWGKTDEEEEAYFNDDDDDDSENTEKNTEDSNKDKSEKSINPRIALANSISGPSRGRIANPNAIVARFIRSTQPLASGLVDYPDDDDIIEEEEEEHEEDEEMTPKHSVKPHLDTKKENVILSSLNKDKKEDSASISKDTSTSTSETTTDINKYSLPNSKIRKIEFINEKKDNNNKNEEKEEKASVPNSTSATTTSANNQSNSIKNDNKINNDNDDKNMKLDNINNKNNNDNNLSNKSNKRSREENDDDDDDAPLPIRKKINKEDDDELFLQSINRNKLKKEASKLNSNEKSKSPLNNKKITLNISPKLKHTEISSKPSTSPSSSTISLTDTNNQTSSLSPSSNSLSTTSTNNASPKKKLFDSNAMDEDEKEPNNNDTMANMNINALEDDNKATDNKKKVDIIINPNLKNINLKKS